MKWGGRAANGREWWSKCHSVENSRWLFALFSSRCDLKLPQGQTGQGFIFRCLWKAGASKSFEVQHYGGVIYTPLALTQPKRAFRSGHDPFGDRDDTDLPEVRPAV